MFELEKDHHQRLPGETFLPKVDSHRKTAAETEPLSAVVVVAVAAGARQEPERARIEQQYKDLDLAVVQTQVLEEQIQMEQLRMACQLVLAKAWWPPEEVLVEELLEHSTALRPEHQKLQVSRLEAWHKSLARLHSLAWKPYFLL